MHDDRRLYPDKIDDTDVIVNVKTRSRKAQVDNGVAQEALPGCIRTRAGASERAIHITRASTPPLMP